MLALSVSFLEAVARHGELSGFHELLEAVQVVPHLIRRRFLKQDAHQSAGFPVGWLEGDKGLYFSAPTRGIAKFHPAEVGNAGTRFAFPRDASVLEVFSDVGDPADLLIEWRFDGPS